VLPRIRRDPRTVTGSGNEDSHHPPACDCRRSVRVCCTGRIPAADVGFASRCCDHIGARHFLPFSDMRGGRHQVHRITSYRHALRSRQGPGAHTSSSKRPSTSLGWEPSRAIVTFSFKKHTLRSTSRTVPWKTVAHHHSESSRLGQRPTFTARYGAHGVVTPDGELHAVFFYEDFRCE
jgi:hypothetical protein